MRDCGLALLWFSQSILVAIVTREIEELEKNLVAIVTREIEKLEKNLVAFVTMTFHLYSKKKSNSSKSLVTTATRRTIGLVAIVARHFERLEKKILWHL